MHASRLSTIGRIPLFTLVAGVGLTIGFLVPVAYELTEKPWNRTRLVGLERAAMVTAALTCALCVLKAWVSKGDAPAAAEPKRKIQFRLWQLLAAITVAAILLAVMKWLVFWAIVLVPAVVLGVLGWVIRQEARVQSRTAAVLAVLFCPQVWMVAYNAPFGRTSGLLTALPIAPAILPSALIRAVTYRSGPDHMAMVAGAIVIAELLVGAWLAWRGGKLFVAYLILVLLVSCISSFGMHALYRA
jgi:hypothetical protein